MDLFPGFQVCQCCGKDEKGVEPYRMDGREDGVMLCPNCAESYVDTGMPLEHLKQTEE
jgi:hypothetical protein